MPGRPIEIRVSPWLRGDSVIRTPEPDRDVVYVSPQHCARLHKALSTPGGVGRVRDLDAR